MTTTTIEPRTVISGVQLPLGWAIDRATVKDENGKTVLGLGRMTMLLRAAKRDDFISAWESRMSWREMAEMFGCNDSSDIAALRRVYQVEPRAKAAPTYKVQRVGIDTDELAERVVAVALNKVSDALTIQVKLAVANALEDVAHVLRGGSGDVAWDDPRVQWPDADALGNEMTHRGINA